jgi:hypothetical protein
MSKRLLFILILTTMVHMAYTQNDTTPPLKYSSTVWGNIFTAFYYIPSAKVMPNKGFEFSTGLLGYRGQWGDRATATLIYDVFRTTDRIEVRDTSGNLLPVTYGSRGSDYTAFLKMAQIDNVSTRGLIFRRGRC